MELMQQVKGNYSDSREEEEEEEAAEIITRTREAESSRLHQQDGASNFGKKLELMELSLGSNKEGGVHDEEGEGGKEVVEKEHMFDKVVTPSDVGKLNRYSYWNSSQSYVMTKGWSRFVKEKKLDAGDTVSFHRGLGDLYRQRLYIDWRRRTENAHSHAPDPLFLPSIRWYSLPPSNSMPPRYNHLHLNNYNNLFTFQQNQYLPPPPHPHPHPHPHHHHHNNYAHHNSGSASLYYLRSMPGPDQNLNLQGRLPIIIDSVPVNVNVAHRHAATAAAATATSNGKRLRLFGVNMECASSPEDSKAFSSSSTTTVGNSSLPSSSLHHRLRVPHAHQDPLSSSARFADHKGGGGASTATATASSLLFDLDPSLQYRH
ncbi:hypothetical protein VNO78_18663 [Psophocarpus tetragonolobus]|uniref:TF-B3 domain-containing protein n=1 Tax=Psophocarpus tetragonolobus TaxID=3891 RepID=A0AAN9SIU7_PSOTE